jgi:hypothetical protein
MASSRLSLFGAAFADHPNDSMAIRRPVPAINIQEQADPFLHNEGAPLSPPSFPEERFEDVTEDARTAGFSPCKWAAVYASIGLLDELEPTRAEQGAGLEMQVEAWLWNVLWASWHRLFIDPTACELQFTFGMGRLRDQPSGEVTQDGLHLKVVVIHNRALPVVLIGRPQDVP